MVRSILSIFLIALSFGVAASGIAAPLWIERKFIPVPELIDPRFAVASEIQSVDLDHGVWTSFLETYLTQGNNAAEEGINRVRYGAVTPAARGQLDGYIAALEATDTRLLTRDQQLAYWINLYNAATVQLILDHYPLSSIRKVKVAGKGPWDHRVVTVLDVALSLGDIEHHIVRAVFRDPRIHYALNCASIGCPNLAASAYEATTLETMLDQAARAYVNHPRGVSVRKGKADVSKIYGWYREDFGAGDTDILAHLERHASGPLKAELAQVEKIARYGYDWALNDAPVAAAR